MSTPASAAARPGAEPETPATVEGSLRRPARRPFVVAIAAFLLWGGLFVYRSSFDYAGERHFVLFDDAMISMAYARNLVEGHGLVWSPGDRPVEGFTHPLWTFALVAANALPLPPHQRSLPVQIGGLALMIALAWRVRALLVAHFPGAAGATSGWLPAVVLTLFHWGLAYWSLMGMESALQALLLVLAVHLAYDVVFAGRDRHLALGVVFAVAYLVRMDMLLAVGVVGAWVLAHGGFRRAAARRWLAGLGVLVAVAGAYQLFRWLWFGAALPNTYDLKLGGVPVGLRLPRGLDRLAVFLREQALVALAVVAAVAAGLGRRSRTLLPGLLILVSLAYGAWVGGDGWDPPDEPSLPSRFTVIVLPLAFVLLNDLLNRLLGAARPALRRGAAAAATAVLLLLVDGLVLSPRAPTRWREMLLVVEPPMVTSHILVLHQLRLLEDKVGPGATVVTYWAGIPAYFSRYRLIDALGFNDRHTARMEVPEEVSWDRYRPGHAKVDPAYLVARRPDAFFQFWNLADLPTRWPRRFMRQRGYAEVGHFWLRRDSPHLLPGAIPPEAAAAETAGE